MITTKKKILLKDLMAAMEEHLAGIALLLVLRAEDIGLNLEEDTPEQTIKSIRARIQPMLDNPSPDASVNKQVENFSNFLKEYE